MYRNVALSIVMLLNLGTLTNKTRGGDLKITEVMYTSTHPPTDVPDTSHNYWWELTNTSSMPINLTGYSWDDNSDMPNQFVFPSVTIGPGESIIVLERPGPSTAVEDFRTAWGPCVTDVTILSAAEFGTSAFPGFGPGGVIYLYDSSKNTLDSVSEDPPYKVGVSNECLGMSCQQSVIGVNGAYQAPGVEPGDIGSPGRIADQVCIPTVSEWGIVTMALLTLTAGTIVLSRRRISLAC